MSNTKSEQTVNPLTKRFFTVLQDSVALEQLQKIKIIMATRSAVKTLQQARVEFSENSPHIAYLLNENSQTLGIKRNVEIPLNYNPDFDESILPTFNENLKNEITVENLVDEMYADISERIADSNNDKSLNAITKKKFIIDLLNEYGVDNSFTLPNNLSQLEQEIKISLMHRLAAMDNLLDLNASKNVFLGNGVIAYCLPDCRPELGYVIHEGKRTPLTRYLAENKNAKYEELLISNHDLTTFLYAMPVEERAALLINLDAKLLNKLIAKEMEKRLVLDAIPRDQRIQLPNLFQHLLQTHLQLDPTLTNNFFKSADRVEIQFEIPLPVNPETLPDFFANAEGQKYRNTVKNIFYQIKL